MLAELHGKVNVESTLPADRLEDTLTDAVFSAVRYLPRTVVLGAILAEVLPDVSFGESELRTAEIMFWPTMPAVLWPGRSIEPDVVIVAGRHVVVFEAKYESDFGEYEWNGQILHQLAVQWRAAMTWAEARQAESVTVVAVTVVPPASLEEAQEQLMWVATRHTSPNASQAVKWMRWTSFADIFRKAQDLGPHEDAVRQDVLAVMERRGVSRMFEGFRPEDYYLVTAAQRVAARRVYPALSTFVVELTGLLKDDGIDWGWPQKGMWAPGGLSWVKPEDWGRGWLATAYWPQAWPKRTIARDQTALYVLFDFVNPAIEVGYVQSPPTSNSIAQHWQPHFEALAEQMSTIAPVFSMAVDTGNWAEPADEVQVGRAVGRWLERLSSFSHLRFRQRLDFTTVTSTGLVREAIAEIREAVDSCPAFHAMLKSSGQIDF